MEDPLTAEMAGYAFGQDAAVATRRRAAAGPSEIACSLIDQSDRIRPPKAER